MTIQYASHGGLHQVAVICCPRILGNRFAHLSQDGPESWALRDFVTGKMLRNSPPPNQTSSRRMLAEIEAEVTRFEAPPFYSVEHVDGWKLYLRLRSSAELGRDDLQPPNPAFGDWEDIV